MGELRYARAALLGVVLTLAAGTGTLALGAATVTTWPGAGVVPVDAALTFVALTGSTVAAAWLTAVLGRASVAVLRTGTADGAAVAGTTPRSVRVACAVLVALTSVGSLPAVAVPHTLVSTDAGVSVDGRVRAGSGGVAHGAVSSDTAPVTVDSRPAPPDEAGRGIPQPGWTPTVVAPRPVAPDGVGLVSTQPHQTLTDQVVVRRGDTLWDIAARHLGPSASLADIAEEWPRWYAANRDVVGPDPDLITPGMELTPPTTGTDR